MVEELRARELLPTGLPVQRVTFNGSYNISPAISPDGKWVCTGYWFGRFDQPRVADFGLEADLFAAVPELTQAL